MRRSQYAILASILVAVVFIGLNLASWKWLAPARADFTANGLYTMSSSARRVVQRLVEPVELELVYSRDVGAEFPAIRAHADRVRQLMNEIAARSGGKVKIRETEPEPFSDEEDRVVAAGLTPAPTNGADPIYFGVIGHNTVDDNIAIPFLAPERDALLEYELVRLISQLDDPAPPKVAVISSLLAYQADPSEPGAAFVLREAKRAFDIEIVPPDFRSLPPDTDVLMLIHPGPMDDWQQYVVDQFMMHKGRALIALDPVSRVSMVQPGAQAIASSSLGRLGETLGVSIGPDTVADRALALPVNVDAGQGRRQVVGQPLFPAVPPALMSKTDVITADLSRPINFGAPGHLIAKPPAGTEFSMLVETTPQAALISADIAKSDPTPRTVLEAYTPSETPQILAGRLSGNLRSSFSVPPTAAPQADPAIAEQQRQEMAKVPPFTSRSVVPAEVIFVADADAFDDGFYVNPQTNTPISDNAAFILNALDNLGGDEALTALRSRAPAARPMDRVDALRAAARDRLYNEQQRLEKLLADAEGRLNLLEGRRKSGATLTAEELAEIDSYRGQASDIRKQLRDVEREFRRDIDALAGQLQFINVWLGPIIVGLIGVGMFIWRSRRRGGRA
jgi:ABC-type uncharacterized transport system involved in gliding motility auxiliary subunit